MQTIQFNHTEENVNKLKNINFVAKNFRKILVFLSKRESSIFKEVDNIKHSNLLYYISKAYGFKSYENFNQEEVLIDNLLIDNLKKELFKGLNSTSNIDIKFFNEAFDLLILDINHIKKETLKSAVMKKIKNRIIKLESFSKIDPYSNKKRNLKEKDTVNKIKEYITEDEYKLIYDFLYDFNIEFPLYEKIINKKYLYVWNPYHFEKIISFNIDEALKESLNKAGIYKIIEEIYEMIPEWVMKSNLIKFKTSGDIIEPTYYIQDEGYDYIEELLFSIELSRKYHMGIEVTNLPQIISDMKSKFLKSKNTNTCLKKITWDKKEIFELNFYTYEDSFFVAVTDSFIYINAGDSVNKDDNIKVFYLDEKSSNIRTTSYINNNEYETENLRSFFLFNNEKNYMEYEFLNKEKVVFGYVKFYIDKVVFKQHSEKLIISYDDLMKPRS